MQQYGLRSSVNADVKEYMWHTHKPPACVGLHGPVPHLLPRCMDIFLATGKTTQRRPGTAADVVVEPCLWPATRRFVTLTNICTPPSARNSERRNIQGQDHAPAQYGDTGGLIISTGRWDQVGKLEKGKTVRIRRPAASSITESVRNSGGGCVLTKQSQTTTFIY